MSKFDYRLVKNEITFRKQYEEYQGGAYDIVESGRSTQTLEYWTERDEEFGNTLKDETFMLEEDRYEPWGQVDEVSYTLQYKPSGEDVWKHFSYAKTEKYGE